MRKSCAGRFKIGNLLQFFAIERHFVRKRLRGTLQHRNFTSVFGDRTRKSCAGRANRNFTEVFDDRTSFRAKELRGTFQNHNFTSVFDDRASFRAKGLRFVPSRCPRLKRKIEKKERARGQESQRAREPEGKRARGQERM